MSNETSKLQDLLNSLKRTLRQIRGLFPSPLPTGVNEFNDWVESIMTTYDLPTSHVDSIRFTLAAMITNMGPRDCSKSKYSLAQAIRASAAKQIAGGVFYEIKTKQLEAQKAQLQAEATALRAASDESKNQGL